MRQRQRQGHCDSRYFPPPLHCRVGITGEEGTLLHNTICGRQSVNQSAQQLHSRAAEEDPGVFALATNKRRGGEDGLCCSRRRLSLPLTHGHSPVARLTSWPLARSPLDGFVFSVMVYLGHVAGRPRGERGEGSQSRHCCRTFTGLPSVREGFSDEWSAMQGCSPRRISSPRIHITNSCTHAPPSSTVCGLEARGFPLLPASSH